MNQLYIKYQLMSNSPNIYFYRDADQYEVDILIETFDGIAPLEVKLSASPNKRDIEKFKVLNKLGRPILSGGIVCLIDSVFPVNDTNCFIPVGLL